MFVPQLIPPPGYVAHVDALREAVALIASEAGTARQDHDAMMMFWLGGAIRLPTSDYIKAFLDLANRPVWDEIHDQHIELPVSDGIQDARILYRAERKKIHHALQSIISDPAGVCKSSRAGWMRAIDGRIAAIPTFEDKSELRLVITDGGAARNFAYLLLTSEFRQKLRRCKLSSCRRFFLDGFQTGERGARQYCKDRGCLKIKDKLENPERAKRSRDLAKLKKSNSRRSFV